MELKRPSKPLKPAETDAAKTGQTTAPPIGDPDAFADVLGRVQVLSGACDGKFDIAGKSVAYARQHLTPILNIDRDAPAFLDGKEISKHDEEATILGENAVLDFNKQSGVKGCS
jgi:hypothetical protein